MKTVAIADTRVVRTLLAVIINLAAVCLTFADVKFLIDERLKSLLRTVLCPIEVSLSIRFEI